MIAYRFFGSLDGKPVPHMHKTRTPFSLDAWNEAEVKWAHNPGSKDQPHYWTGFHTFHDLETARAYGRKFKREAWIAAVEVQDSWTKPTNRNVTLSRYLRLTADAWNNAERIA